MMKLLSKSTVFVALSASALGAVDLGSVHKTTQEHFAKLLQEDPFAIDGLSAACAADYQAFSQDTEFLLAYADFYLTNLNECFATLSAPPTSALQDGDSFGVVAPCDAGVEEFSPVCRNRGGTMCQISFDVSLSIDIDGLDPLSLRYFYSFWTCQPASCTAADGEATFGDIEAQANAVNDNINIDGFSFDIESSIFCDAGTGVPTNFGSGTRTAVEIEGTTTAAGTFTLSCSECDPSWSVSIETDANFNAGELSNVLANALNNNVQFETSGCKSQWIQSSLTYNIYCPDQGTITIGFEPAAPSLLSGDKNSGARQVKLQQSDITNYNGNGVTATGEQSQFETMVNDGNAATSLSSAIAILVSIAVASIQLLK